MFDGDTVNKQNILINLILILINHHQIKKKMFYVNLAIVDSIQYFSISYNYYRIVGQKQTMNND